MKARKMRDNIRLALASGGSVTADDIADHIRKSIDSEAKIITIYLTVRMMHYEGLLVKTGDQYQIKTKGTGLLG